MSNLANLPPEQFETLRPRVASDATVRTYDEGMIAWSPSNPRPTPLDGVSAVVFQILDGSGTVADLVTDIHEVVGISEAVARSQLRYVLGDLAASGLIDGIEPVDEIPTKVDLFPAPPNP